jgi:hypothetical protein
MGKLNAKQQGPRGRYTAAAIVVFRTRCKGLGPSLERTGSNTCLLTKYS